MYAACVHMHTGCISKYLHIKISALSSRHVASGIAAGSTSKSSEASARSNIDRLIFQQQSTLIPFYWEVWSERQMFLLGFTWNLQFLTLHRALQQGKNPREEEPWDAGALATVTSSLGTTTTTSKKHAQTNITTRMNSGFFNSDWMKSENGMECSLWDDKRPSCSLPARVVP